MGAQETEDRPDGGGVAGSGDLNGPEAEVGACDVDLADLVVEIIKEEVAGGVVGLRVGE
jgi:hypothetical protein